jgi:hypothetical protein
MSNLKLAFIAATVAASGTLFPLSSSALTTTFTNQATFLGNVAPGFYLENFNTLSTAGPTASPLPTFSNGVFSYIASVPSGGSFFGANSFGTPAVSLNVATDTILITFTSGNVTALGGNIFASDINGSATTGDIAVVLSDGTNLIVSSPTVPASPGPFRGFISDTPITSLSLTGGDTPTRWATLDNLYVGTSSVTAVPFEFSPVLGLTVLGGLWGANRLRKTIKAK